MAISHRERDEILRYARANNIDDATIEKITEAAGAYRYALTGSHSNPPKARVADDIRARLARHIADREHAVLAEAAAAAGVTPPPAPGTPLATDAQVDYIMGLLARRERTGDAGGFMHGPTTRDGVRAMTKADASLYITSLKEEY